MEILNRENANRTQLLKTYGYIFLFLFGTFLILYIFALDIYKTGQKSSRVWLSYNKFIVFSTIAFIILSSIILASKIVIRLNVDEALDKVTIQYIDRFNFRAKTTEAKLSETQIYIERLEDRYRFFRKRPDHVSVYLTHSNFKSIRIGPQDFETDMEQLAEFLEKIKDVRVQKKQKTTTSTHN